MKHTFRWLLANNVTIIGTGEVVPMEPDLMMEIMAKGPWKLVEIRVKDDGALETEKINQIGVIRAYHQLYNHLAHNRGERELKAIENNWVGIREEEHRKREHYMDFVFFCEQVLAGKVTLT